MMGYHLRQKRESMILISFDTHEYKRMEGGVTEVKEIHGLKHGYMDQAQCRGQSPNRLMVKPPLGIQFKDTVNTFSSSLNPKMTKKQLKKIESHKLRGRLDGLPGRL